ncbi:hypothetical protein FQA39_LY13560 [Lamprigera yunnana]|nr:hypothetical protein FQA39_LY13560 [Lamprigera yunnana]
MTLINGSLQNNIPVVQVLMSFYVIIDFTKKMHQKYPYQKELKDIANCMMDNPESGGEFDNNDICNDSDLNDEKIENNNHDTLAEQSALEEEQGEVYFDKKFYVGKDKITKWSKKNFKNISRTKSINIVKIPVGIKPRTKDISNELDEL